MLEPLFKAIRGACSSRNWSQGIELARGDNVDGVDEDDERVCLRVKTPGVMVPPEVNLYPDDQEWDCECESNDDACKHVAAAIIALRKARKDGARLPSSSKAGGRLGYRLELDGQRVAVRRVLVGASGEQTLKGSLAGLLANPEKGRSVEPTQTDLSIDRFLSMKRVRSLPPDSLAPLLALLADAEDVQLDGNPVTASAEPLKPRAVVEADGRVFVLRVEANEQLTRMVVPGIALCRSTEQGDERLTLRSLAHTQLTGPSLERLPTVERFERDRVAELVGEVMPIARRRFDVEMRCELPRTSSKLLPRVLLDVSQRGSALSLLPLLVYGDPPCARVDGAKLMHLRGPIPKRDERAERRARVGLNDALGLSVGERRDFVAEDAIKMAARLRSYDGPIEGDVHLSLYARKALTPEVVIDGERLDIRFEQTSADGHAVRAEPQAVLDAWQRGAGLVPLLDGGWGSIPADWLDKHGPRLLDLLRARDADGRVAPHAAPDLALMCDDLERPRPPSLDRLTPLLDGFQKLPRAKRPDDLRAELRDYQAAGIDWLCFMRDAGLGAVLADDMGLGKTLQSLCAMRSPALVVCPTSVVPGWVEQIERFRPGLRHSVYHGSGRELDTAADITLTTYSLLRRDVEALAAIRWATVVLDESQMIKNPDSQVARAAYRLKADFRLTMSGTPVENRLEELWSQLHFANRGLLAGRQDFHNRYEQPIAGGDAEAAARLRARIRPFVLRRMKEDVAEDLPPRTEALLHCQLDESERVLYDAIRLSTQRQVVARLEAGGNVLEALEALLRLRQAACDAALVPGQAGQFANDEHGAPRASSKLRRLLSALDETVAGAHKALVFSQWTSLLDRVEPQLDKHGIGYCRLDGSTRDRGAVVDAFQSKDGPPVMLISLKAGGTGLNLTAADHVFLLDPWWNPAVEQQAADRAHRIGQDRPVFIYRLVASDTVEERILALQERKRALADAALGEAGRAASLTRDDLLTLFQP
jgi:superfamily II DNA or RNA helicase